MITLSLVTGTIGDREESLLRLFDSVRLRTEVEWELIIANAGPELPELVRANPRVRVVDEHPRLGHSRGYNKAFAAATGEWVIWLNDDAEVLAGYDIAAVDFMRKHSYIGLGAMRYTENEKGGRFTTNKYQGMMYANFGIISKVLGDRVGWFDEKLRMYGADNSLTFRVLMAGYGVADVPFPAIIHRPIGDEQRLENQIGRNEDAQLLMHTYGRHLEGMRLVYHEAWNRLR